MLMEVGRRGFTLVEVMLSVVMTVVVAGAIYNLLVTTQRVTRLQVERTNLQSGIRAGSLIVLEELAELNTVEAGTDSQNDIVAFGTSAITYRAMRGIGFICQTPDATTIRLARASFSGHRDPQSGRDEAYVFVPGNPDAQTQDSWVPAKIVSVTTAGPCPGGLGTGITLGLQAGVPLGTVEPGTPVRIAELMELRLYRSDGESWLGARSINTGEAIQPLVGPLTDADGFQLEFVDRTGAPTADHTRIKSIRISLRGTTPGEGVERGRVVEEELISHVTLRNSPRP